MSLIDCRFQKDSYNRQKTFGETPSIMIAIKNILLMSPGNIPSLPDCGMDIANQKFEFADNELKNKIRTKLSRQCATYIPSLENCTVDIDYTDDPINNLRKGLAITIKGYLSDIEKEIHLKYNVTRTRNGTVAISATTI